LRLCVLGLATVYLIMIKLGQLCTKACHLHLPLVLQWCNSLM